MAGKDFRWAAVILGLGGVLLLVRGANRRTAAAVLALLGWLAVDVVGDRLNVRGPLALLVAGSWWGRPAVPVPVTPPTTPDPDPAEPTPALVV